MTVKEFRNFPPALRLLVLENIGRSNDPNAGELLLSAISDGDPYVRQEAQDALIRRSPHPTAKGKPLPPRLTVRELHGLPYAQRLIALSELGRSDHPNAVELLESAYNDSDAATRRITRESLDQRVMRARSTQTVSASSPASSPVAAIQSVESQITGPVPVPRKPRRSWFAANGGLLFGFFFLFGVPLGLLLTYVSPTLGFGLIFVHGVLIFFMWVVAVPDHLTGKSRRVEGQKCDLSGNGG